MSFKPGTDLGGIRTEADLQARCWIDEATGCWHWRGSLSGGRYPSMYLPALRRCGTLGTVIGWLRTGEFPEPGVAWFVTCGTPNCATPAHRKRGTRSQQMRAAKLTRNPLTRARISAAKRRKLTDEALQDIRSSTEVLRVLAGRWGLSISSVSKVRRGELAGHASGATVFGWRP